MAKKKAAVEEVEEAEALKASLIEQKPIEKINFKNGLSTGSTLLNLAITGRPSVGLVRGKYYFLVGDSSSGKSFLSMTCLAEAATNPLFQNYRFIYDDVEEGMLANIERYFGKSVAQRLEPPARDDGGMPRYSTTIEEFYFHIDDAREVGAPFIYILDSMDALDALDDQEKFEDAKDAWTKGKSVTGSYGTAKAKANSTGIRRLIPALRETGSILIVISQTRDNIGFGAQFNPKTRSGGKALRFYACCELWSSIASNITKEVKGQKKQIGINAKIEIKKNRLTGKQWSVEVPIYWSSGIDDTGSLVAFLLDNSYWPKSKNGIVEAGDFKFKGRQESLIEHIETKGLEKQLQALVADVWSEIEDACQVKRKQRYQ
jgi:RecA/RadA recombinase